MGLHQKRIDADLASQPARNDGSSNSNLGGDDTPIGPQPAQDNASIDLVEDVTTKIFAHALTDDPSKVLFRRYTSHTEYPQTQSTAPMPDLTANSETMDAVIDAIGRLDLEPQKSSNPNTLSKRERNILTNKAHASLSHIEKHIVRLLSVLDAKSPSADDISGVENELQILQTTFYGLKRKTESLEKRKIGVKKSFLLLEARILACRSIHPTITTPVLFNTGEPSTCVFIVNVHSDSGLLDHHFQTPINSLLPAAQVTMFLAVFCSVMMGISRRFGDFLMKMLSINLRVAFEQTKKPNDEFTNLQKDILSGITQNHRDCNGTIRS